MLRHRDRWPGVLVGLVAFALLTVTGCGSADTPPGTATQPGTTLPATTESPIAGAATVTATLTDFKVELSTTSFTAGSYTFIAEQKGQRPHALSIKGPGVDTTTTPTIQPGGASQQITVTLQPGTYELWCPVGNHKEQGMTVTVTVR
jgi:plastocyanin